MSPTNPGGMTAMASSPAAAAAAPSPAGGPDTATSSPGGGLAGMSGGAGGGSVMGQQHSPSETDPRMMGGAPPAGAAAAAAANYGGGAAGYPRQHQHHHTSPHHAGGQQTSPQSSYMQHHPSSYHHPGMEGAGRGPPGYGGAYGAHHYPGENLSSGAGAGPYYPTQHRSGGPKSPPGMAPTSPYGRGSAAAAASRGQQHGGVPGMTMHGQKNHHMSHLHKGVVGAETRGDREEANHHNAAVMAASMGQKGLDMTEAQRLRSSAEAELCVADVKPIQTDFHFFVQEMRDKLKIEAENEVRESVMKASSSNNSETGGPTKKLDPFLVNSNLNCRILKAWEDLAEEKRTFYMKKEEEDRHRFMQEEEVASRHCATLTARAKSPDKKADSPSRASKQKNKRKSPSPKPVSKDRAGPSPSPPPQLQQQPPAVFPEQAACVDGVTAAPEPSVKIDEPNVVDTESSNAQQRAEEEMPLATSPTALAAFSSTTPQTTTLMGVTATNSMDSGVDKEEKKEDDGSYHDHFATEPEQQAGKTDIDESGADHKKTMEPAENDNAGDKRSPDDLPDEEESPSKKNKLVDEAGNGGGESGTAE